jgi:transposase
MKEKMGTKKVRCKHTEEFKKQVLERAEKEGIPATAKALNLESAQLYAWKKQARLSNQAHEVQARLESENTRLKREMQRLEEELAFLKKCATYFARIPK